MSAISSTIHAFRLRNTPCFILNVVPGLITRLFFIIMCNKNKTNSAALQFSHFLPLSTIVKPVRGLRSSGGPSLWTRL